ncbi:DJ-1/PfpI family protein [uncultured Campylobacter sp.]|uniref:DJ-1/PfpI family protein n=1 Tax=uncultured Campylobacter sp. TaxID=218934 RepID=UPI00262FC9AD|nr:DJ-1/PfpI family protein [uncultured Campylobacter sp.]
MRAVNVLLYEGFTTMDALGPAEALSRALDDGRKCYEIEYFSVAGGLVGGSTNAKIWTRKLNEIAKFDVLLVPGGFAARKLAHESGFIAILGELARRHEYVIAVCTGSVLLAKIGLLDGMEATSNKLSWQWAILEAPGVRWIRGARWCVSGKFYTGSGVSAGIDAALGFIADMHGRDEAQRIARAMEYVWNSDKNADLF